MEAFLPIREGILPVIEIHKLRTFLKRKFSQPPERTISFSHTTNEMVAAEDIKQHTMMPHEHLAQGRRKV